MSAKPDTDLVSAARAGDGSAYAELFARYEQRIYTYAYGIVGNTEDARDIAQDAFIRVFEALPRTTGELNFSAYLYRTAHNVAIDAIKDRARFVAPEALDVQPDFALRADPERVALLREQQEQTWRATFALSESQRAVLALRELHELSYQDIAEVLEMPRTTVGVTLSRARLKFKEAFRMSSVDTEHLAEECRDMLGLLSAYIDDELSAEERDRVDEHLEACAFCRLALEEMTEASRSYRVLLPLLPPAALGASVLGNVETAHAAPDPETGSGSETAPAGKTVLARQHVSARLPLGMKIALTAVLLAVLVVVGYFTYRFVSGADPGSPDSPFELPTAERPIPKIALQGGTAPASEVGDAQTRTDAEAPEQTQEPAEQPAEDSAATNEPPAEETEDESETGAIVDTEAPPTPDALSPADGTFVSSDSVTLSWLPVDDPSGVTYTLQLEAYSADTGTYYPEATVDGLTTTTYAHTMGSTAERWRVFAVDGAGNASQPTAWQAYSRFLLLVPVEPIEEPPTLY